MPDIQQTGQPEADADALRSSVGPMRAPYDPIAIARRIGIEVFLGGVNAETAGCLVKRYGENAQIFLNASDSPNRQRFTCAHEVGHYVRRISLSEDWSATDARDYASTTGLDPEERYANQFAAALLMPAREVRELRQTGASIAGLAIHFRVSNEAMRYRVDNLHA